MIAAIHQPDYIPWMGYFYKISRADLFIFLDDAQYSSTGMHDWNYIKTPQGRLRLRVPVRQNFGDPINRVVTQDNLRWKKKHLKAIELNYSHAPFYGQIFPEFERMLLRKYESLALMNEDLIRYICGGFGFKTKFAVSSEMGISSVKENRVIDLCAAVGADTYYSGNGARSYQQPSHFERKGIKLLYSDFNPLPYSQRWEGFLPSLSAIDYVFNCGFRWPYG